MPTRLDYFHPSTGLAEPRSPLVSTAMACGAGPMAAGVSVMITWVLPRSESLLAVGAFIAMVGFVLFVLGILCLVVHVLINWQYLNRAPERTAHWWSISYALMLLLGNWVLLAVCLLVGSMTGAGR